MRWRPAVAMFTTARGSESLRTRWVGGCLPRLVGTEDQEQGLRRALCNGGWGGVWRFGGGSNVGRLCPGSPVAVVAVNGTSPSGRYPTGSHAAVVRLRPAGHRQDGLVVQAPPTATGDPGPPHLWEGFPHLELVPSPSGVRALPPRVRREVDPVHTTGVLSRIPRRCRRAQPSWPGRWCQAERDQTTARAIRLDTTGPASFLQATTATRDPGQRRPQLRPPPNRQTPPRPPLQRPAGGTGLSP